MDPFRTTAPRTEVGVGEVSSVQAGGWDGDVGGGGGSAVVHREITVPLCEHVCMHRSVP